MEKISIGISIVSLIFVAVNIFVTIYTNNKKIKADLVSKARIEWIQEVRKATSKLISAYSELAKIKPNNSNEYLNKVVDFQEKNEILILFFGNDSVSDNESEKFEKMIYFDKNTSSFVVKEEIKYKLLEKGSNKNKNDIIVFYLKSLKKYFDHFNNNYSKKIKEKDKWENAELENFDKSMFTESYEHEFFIPQYVAEYGYEDMVSVSLNEYIEFYEKEANYYSTKLNFFNIPTHIINNMAFLSDVMRLYLKIEWNEAKTNK